MPKLSSTSVALKLLISASATKPLVRSIRGTHGGTVVGTLDEITSPCPGISDFGRVRVDGLCARNLAVSIGAAHTRIVRASALPQWG